MNPLKALLAVATLSGCAYRAPIVVQAPQCAPDMAMQPCASPVSIREGSTFSELLSQYLIDRQSLQSCALDQEYLRKVIAACNTVVKEHNQKAMLQAER
ncbi:Rz1-like lysis system protein LysC [Corallococcus llansteffanensis]|uniref:Lipoprotein n=1 Tax=Corallococcus llansteffanensis TaxID=2316731 RepID=A0A3A8QHV3_9BACT|nr:hypothetical protein [Corallococcus llansteffanensis]RKH68286.1 hypothetical protein D7V93_01590 [Corallococcus llansteffanensis]